MSASAVYEGWIRHRRFEPVEHEFRYRLFLHLPRPRRAARRCSTPSRSGRRGARPRPASAAPTSWATRERPLAECARDEVEAATGRRPGGPVRMLANLRYLGHVFNPVAFYYCFDPAGERVEAVVADVNNIPWGERHPYVLSRGRSGRGRPCWPTSSTRDSTSHP